LLQRSNLHPPQLLQKLLENPTYLGIIDMTRSGSAYLVTDDLEDDVYISSKNLGGAMHKDKVEIELVSQRKGRKPEGIVVAILKRALNR
jgi:exoribonuclease R